MNISIIINDKKQDKVIPIRWEQVTFKQFLDITDCGDDWSRVLSVFTGMEPETIKRAKIKNLDQVMRLLSFLHKPCPAVIPEKILFYTLPKDLGFETIAQLEDLTAYIKGQESKKGRALLEKYPLLVAIYCSRHMSRERTDALAKEFNDQSIKFGEYHWRKAESMQEEFLNCPAPEVLGIGNFTLLKPIELMSGIEPAYPIRITQTTRLRLVLKRFLLRMDFTEHFSIWKKKLLTKGTNY